ncbi:hypothetical protein SNOUR_22615 [Streptomyces noursei ATCC 11455]|nr:hypothetical protein SNOUR_22615 [Streptomyces noursei ATCC 11455]
MLWKNPVRGIHFLLAPRMARRMWLWTLDNPGLSYQEALRWEAAWICEREQMRESHGWMWRWRASPIERMTLRVTCFRPTTKQLSGISQAHDDRERTVPNSRSPTRPHSTSPPSSSGPGAN